MKKRTETKTKNSTYFHPKIERIVLDNEIALQLESTPPQGPNEAKLAPEYLSSNPFKDYIS